MEEHGSPVADHVFVQDGNHGDPVLGPHRPPLLPGPRHHGGGLQVSAAGAA